MFFTIRPSDLSPMLLIGHVTSTLYSSVNWSSLYTRRKTHWLMLIYKTLLGLTPHYLRYLLQPSSSCQSRSVKGPQSTHFPGSLLISVRCKKHSNWTVLSPSLHSRTQSMTLLLRVVAASRDVLLSPPSCPLCCCLCPIMFVACFVLLPCCAAAMLCCYHVVVMWCCYHAVFMCCCHIMLLS